LNPDVVIVGAGIAGLSAAAELSNRGLSCLVVEQGLFPGGRGAELSCKAAQTCAKCNACLLEETLTAFVAAEKARLACQASVVSCRLNGQGYRLTIAHEPTYLDQEKCLDCGLCLQVCPARDLALRRSPVGLGRPGFNISGRDCLFFQGQDCRACQSVCPVEAIDLSASPWEEEVNCSAVIVAVGFTPFDPRLKPRFGYGRLPNVVTALELDRLLRTQAELKRPSDGAPPHNIAFIQCVGSRDKSLGRDYCSRICCGYALRLARLILNRRPETAISFFYMDVQNFGRDFDRFFHEIQSEIELIHGLPGEITAGAGGSSAVPFLNETTGRKETRTYDLVVLSIGLGPPDEQISRIFPLERNEDGFLLADDRTGLFVAGSAQGPMDLAEAKAWGEAAAGRAADFLRRRK